MRLVSFIPLLRSPSVKMIGVEAGGRSLRLGEHAARFKVDRRAFSTEPIAICCRMNEAR